MSVKNMQELSNSNIVATGNNPVKMPKKFGNIMSNYYRFLTHKYQKKVNIAENNISELNNVISKIDDSTSYAYGELTSQKNDQERKLDEYNSKLAKYYNRYEANNSKVLGFNKSKIHYSYAKYLSFKKLDDENVSNVSDVDAVTNTNETLANIPEIDTSNNMERTPLDASQIEEQVQPVNENIDVSQPPLVNLETSTVENVSKTEVPSDNAKMVYDIIKSMQEESQKKDEIIKEKDEKINEQLLELNKLRKQAEELEILKQQVEELKNKTNMSTSTPQPVNIATPTPVFASEPPVNNNQTNRQPFMEFITKINGSSTKEQLEQVRTELNISKGRFEINEQQYNILNNNINNAIKKIEATNVMQSNINPQVNVTPQIDPNLFANYSMKISNAVNTHNLNELLQLQGEIYFNKNKFSATQFNYLVNNLNNGLKTIDSVNQTSVRF